MPKFLRVYGSIQILDWKAWCGTWTYQRKDGPVIIYKNGSSDWITDIGVRKHCQPNYNLQTLIPLASDVQS